MPLWASQAVRSCSMSSCKAVLIKMFLYRSAFLNIMWDFMNDASLLVILSLVSIDIPGMVQDIQLVFLQFIYLDILQTDKWLPYLFYPDYDQLGDQGLNSYFEINSFGSTRAVINLGSTLVYLLLQLGMVIGLLVLRILSHFNSWFHQGYLRLKAYLVWSSLTRFFIQ